MKRSSPSWLGAWSPPRFVQNAASGAWHRILCDWVHLPPQRGAQPAPGTLGCPRPGLTGPRCFLGRLCGLRSETDACTWRGPLRGWRRSSSRRWRLTSEAHRVVISHVGSNPKQHKQCEPPVGCVWPYMGIGRHCAARFSMAQPACERQGAQIPLGSPSGLRTRRPRLMPSSEKKPERDIHTSTIRPCRLFRLSPSVVGHV